MYKLKVSFHCWRCKRIKLRKERVTDPRAETSGICKKCATEYSKPYNDARIEKDKENTDRMKDNPPYIRSEEERSEEARNNLKELTE